MNVGKAYLYQILYHITLVVMFEANSRNQQKFLTPADFHFSFNEIVKELLHYVLQVILNV